jgi:glyoxylase-like metal-dependent hydrolase (beta-lactamase superfamily II)
MDRRLEETAAYQVEAFGFRQEQVKHIVLTHLHCDHTGGLPDFPHAQVHVFAKEFETAMHPRGPLGRFYEPEHWQHGPDWRIYERQDVMDWFGFESIRIMDDIQPEVRFIPLPGHTKGHCGVALREDAGWLLHAGDATYPFYQSGDPLPPFKPLPWYVMNPPGLLERIVTGKQTPRLKALLAEHADRVRIICSNDLITFSQVEARSAAI